MRGGVHLSELVHRHQSVDLRGGDRGRIRATPARRGYRRPRRGGGWRRSAGGYGVKHRFCPNGPRLRAALPTRPAGSHQAASCVEEHGRRDPPDGGGHEGGAPPHQVGVEGADRVAADRDVALLAALAAEPAPPGLARGGRGRRRRGRSPRRSAPRPVQELEQRAVAQHPRVRVVGRPGRVEQPLDLVDGDRLGQPPRRRGRRDLAGRVVRRSGPGRGRTRAARGPRPPRGRPSWWRAAGRSRRRCAARPGTRPRRAR